jgi:hypothetical protein
VLIEEKGGATSAPRIAGGLGRVPLARRRGAATAGATTRPRAATVVVSAMGWSAGRRPTTTATSAGTLRGPGSVRAEERTAKACGGASRGEGGDADADEYGQALLPYLFRSSIPLLNLYVVLLSVRRAQGPSRRLRGAPPLEAAFVSHTRSSAGRSIAGDGLAPP